MEDRLKPKCPEHGWSQFEEWAGMRWFNNNKPLTPATDDIEDAKGEHDERTERFNDLD